MGSKDEKQRRRRVQRAWQYFDQVAQSGPEMFKESVARASESMEGATLEEQERIAKETVLEMKDSTMPLARRYYAAANQATLEHTGMTVEDFVWLRDYEK